MENKKYYYLKLKEDYFDSDEIKVLESMENGYLYSNILLKLYLKALKNDGKLMFNEFIPYDNKMLATITGHNVDVVEKAIKVFQAMHIIEILDNGAIYMLNIQKMIGSISSEGIRKAQYRERINIEKNTNGTLMGQSPDIISISNSISNSNFVSISNEDNNRVIGEEKETYTEQYKEICEYLNLRANTNYRPTSKEFQKHVKARLNEGYTVDDFKKVIDIKVDKWLDDPKWCDYLRPQTLFGTKFEAYLNEKPRYKKETKDFMDECNIKTDRTGGLF